MKDVSVLDPGVPGLTSYETGSSSNIDPNHWILGSSQLDRIEHMLSDLHYASFCHWQHWEQFNFTTQLEEPVESGPRVLDHLADVPSSAPATPSRSRLRRLRKAATCRQHWSQIHDSSDETDAEKAPRNKRFKPSVVIGEQTVKDMERLPMFSKQSLLMYKVACDQTECPAELLQLKMVAPVPPSESSASAERWLTDMDLVADMSTKCFRCKQPAHECICDEVGCRSCLRIASRCDCAKSCVFRSKCPACGREADESLFGGEFLPQTSMAKTCNWCGHTSSFTDWENSGEFLLLQSAEECSKCHRIDAQELIKQCDALCGAFAHECCMQTFVPEGCPHNTKLHRCTTCAETGRNTVCGQCAIHMESPQTEAEARERAQLLQQDANERSKALASIGLRVNGIIDVVEAVDAGRLKLPKPVRDLAFSIARDTHKWLLSKPLTAEVVLKVKYIDDTMEKIKTKISYG